MWAAGTHRQAGQGHMQKVYIEKASEPGTIWLFGVGRKGRCAVCSIAVCGRYSLWLD